MSLIAGWYSESYAPHGYFGCWGLSSRDVVQTFPDYWLRGPYASDTLLDGRLYAWGGSTQVDTVGATNLARCYDIETGVWEVISPYPAAATIVYHTACVHDGALYSLGGVAFAGSTTYYNHFYRYDPSTDSWTALAVYPTVVAGAALVSLGDFIYAVGGTTGAGDLTTVRRYDPATNTWATRASLPAARAYGVATVIDGRIIYTGGYSSTTTLTASAAVYEYDPVANTWTSLASMPSDRRDHHLFRLPDGLHVIGGGGNTPGQRRHFVYDRGANTWTTLPDPPVTVGAGVFGVYAGTAISLLSATGSVVWIPEDGPEPYPSTLGYTRFGCDEVVAQDPRDYVRLSISVDAGSLLDSTDVPVVESGISIAFDPVVTLDQSALYPVWEPLRERGVGDPDHVFYPRGVQSSDRLTHYAGETILSWIDRVKAPRLFAKVSDIPALAGELIDGRFVTLQAAVDHWFSTLAARFAPRFQYAPVPDLRYATPEGTYDADEGLPLVELFTFDQPTGSELTIRQVLDQMLSVCGGQAAILVKQDGQGRLELVPSVGPDAITEPVVVLTGDDVERVTTGDRDPRQSFNSATARNTVWTEQDDVGIMQPAWFQAGSRGRFGVAGWFEEPPDRLNLQPTSDPTVPLQESLPSDARFSQQRPGLWRVSGEALPGAGGIRLRDSGGTYMVELAWRRYLGTGSLQESGTDGLVPILDEIPTTGEWVTPFRFSRVVGAETARLDIQMRYAGPAGVEIRFGPAQLETACFIAPCDLWVIEFNLSDASRGFAPGAELSATFSLDNGDLLPAPGGGNALAESEEEFGVQHADLTISVVSLGPTDLADIARAFVMANIEPKLVREVEQSPKRGFPVRPSHVGYRVQLPSGEVGRVPSRTIDADYARPGAGSIRSTFRAEITESRVDTTTEWLLNDDGSYWTNDDGTPSQPA